MEVRCDVRCGTVQRLRVAGHSLSTLPTTTKRRGRRRRLMHGRAGWYWQLLPQLWRRASVEALLFCCHLTGTAQPRTSVSAAAFLCHKNEILEGTLHGFTQNIRTHVRMHVRTHAHHNTNNTNNTQGAWTDLQQGLCLCFLRLFSRASLRQELFFQPLKFRCVNHCESVL